MIRFIVCSRPAPHSPMERNISIEKFFMLVFSKSASGLTVQIISLISYVNAQALWGGEYRQKRVS